MQNEQSVPDPQRSTAAAIKATASAIQDVAATQASYAPAVLGLFNSWIQFGLAGIMGAIASVLVGGMLWSASQDRKQHSTDLGKVLDSIQVQHTESISAQNRQADGLAKAIDRQGAVMTDSVKELTHEIRTSRAVMMKQNGLKDDPEPASPPKKDG